MCLKLCHEDFVTFIPSFDASNMTLRSACKASVVIKLQQSGITSHELGSFLSTVSSCSAAKTLQIDKDL